MATDLKTNPLGMAVRQKPKSNVYTVLLTLSLLALIIACVFLWMDIEEYKITFQPDPPPAAAVPEGEAVDGEAPADETTEEAPADEPADTDAPAEGETSEEGAEAEETPKAAAKGAPKATPKAAPKSEPAEDAPADEPAE